MRAALESLTTRGRSFLAAGMAAVACAFLLGERDLLRAGVLVIALPLLCALTVSRTRYRLACSRRLEPGRIPVGHEARVDLRLDNVSRLPTGLLLVEDRVPYTLGGRTRFVLDRIEPRGTRELAYRVSSDVRGKYRLGPLSVRVADPFGLVELARSFTAADTLVVTPAIVPLPASRLTGAWLGGGDSRARTVATAGEGDVAPREYRHGDDLRRVHWKSTARHGELMVRREEQQLQSRGALFLDCRRRAHHGEGAGSSFEQAVSAAASIGVHLNRLGFAMRLVTDRGETPPAGGSFENTLLDTLAAVRLSSGRSLQTGLTALRGTMAGAGEGDGLVVAVFGRLTADEARRVAATRRGTATCLAVLLDVGTATVTGDPARGSATSSVNGPSGPSGDLTDDTAGDAAGDPGAAVLRGAGWRVLTVRSAAALAGAWALADQAPGDRIRTAGGHAVGHGTLTTGASES
jgi:uncharacterized protein (DUF58 family)